MAAMNPDDEPWPAAPEAEAFKLALFALVRLKAYEPLAAAVLDGRSPGQHLVARRVRTAAHRGSARRTCAACSCLHGHGPLYAGVRGARAGRPEARRRPRNG